jgi:uncharacterized BrkB/YihY/UPF0761 family membrane protein
MQNIIMIILVSFAGIFLIYSVLGPVFRKKNDANAGCSCSGCKSSCSVKTQE